MRRREFLAQLGAAAAAAPSGLLAIAEAAPLGRPPRILLRSSWQVVNIGDIAHTPGVLRLLYDRFPQAEIRLWPSSVAEGVDRLLLDRFPSLKIVQGAGAIQAALAECDFLLHGSGASLVAYRDVARWRSETGKPYGVFGITFSSTDPGQLETLSQARFVYFRDSLSLKFAQEHGVRCPVMEFGPDGAFAVDLRNDAAAETFLRQHELQPGQFLCVIPRLRYTPYWTIPSKKQPFDPVKHARNEEMKEHDCRPLRDAIAAVARQTSLKVLVCPEDQTQMKVGKELLVDPLPQDVRSKVVWRENYWLTDEALSTYIRSAGLFGLEMHSPIMCIGNGVPALVGRFAEQTTKGFMWRDIGLGDWLFDFDKPEEVARLVPTVLSLARDPEAAKAKAAQARELVRKRFDQSLAHVAESLSG